jgi:hypothetical protein
MFVTGLVSCFPVLASCSLRNRERERRNQGGNSSPISTIVLLYCILQETVFFCCPCIRTFGLIALAVQGIMPSFTTLLFRSTRNQRGNSSPIFAILLLYCILQRVVFFFCPFTKTCGRLIALGVLGLVPLPVHWFFVRPGTSAEIAAQSSPLCFSTASFRLLSSSFVHLPTRATVSSCTVSKEWCHLPIHWFIVQPGTSAETATHCVLYSPRWFFLQGRLCLLQKSAS